MAPELRRAVASRDSAFTRTRRVTAGAIAVGAALTAAFTALAAGSTHLRKAVVHRVRVRTPAAKPVTAPVPPLVAAHEAAPPPPSSPGPQQLPQSVPPVVVSGGS